MFSLLCFASLTPSTAQEWSIVSGTSATTLVGVGAASSTLAVGAAGMENETRKCRINF
jgi:hypothetical protein